MDKISKGKSEEEIEEILAKKRYEDNNTPEDEKPIVEDDIIKEDIKDPLEGLHDEWDPENNPDHRNERYAEETLKEDVSWI